MIDIKDKSKCCGCAACVQRCPKQCITMLKDNEGFLYPKVDVVKCIDCGLCEKACPVLNVQKERLPQKVYAAKNRDEEIRRQSSSGGIFTILAEKTINAGGVVFGVMFNKNWEVVHSYTETIEGLAAFRGSKYVQSIIGNSYKQAEAFLKQGREVLFSGTPCQIAGLKRFLRKEYDNLLTVECVCHGVPSPLVWREYLENIDPEIVNVNFREKSRSWKKYNFVVNGRDNTVNQLFYNNPYMQGFLRDIYLRPSCYACPAKSSKSGADITLGDFWGIDNYMPEIDDDRGVSLVMLHTEKGVSVFNAISCTKVEADYKRALAGNPSIERNAGCNPKYRRMFWKSENRINEIPRIISKMKPSLIRKYVGYAKRIIKKIIFR